MSSEHHRDFILPRILFNVRMQQSPTKCMMHRAYINFVRKDEGQRLATACSATSHVPKSRRIFRAYRDCENKLITDISGIERARPFHFIVISYHLIITLLLNALLVGFILQVFSNKLSLICSTCVSTLNQLLTLLLFIDLI